MKYLKIFIILGVLFGIALGLRGKISHQVFDSEAWKNANMRSENEWSLRWDMMNDLRKKHHLIGMKRKEIVDLLGYPEEPSTEMEFRYYLGYSKKGINTGSLIITFNDKGIVKAIKVWQG
jgi:hypothetical protein